MVVIFKEYQNAFLLKRSKVGKICFLKCLIWNEISHIGVWERPAEDVDYVKDNYDLKALNRRIGSALNSVITKKHFVCGKDNHEQSWIKRTQSRGSIPDLIKEDVVP